ncbi:SNF7 family protein [Trichinella nativa]|uniref:SNF7 family protein n=1 Tax=Trichinella nativa TaxID=6335 RepID=A0A1Y3EUA5_9BILA|nr:SNF7 family protein [Trichinella nativa]
MSAVIENHLFNLKFASKELLRNAKKCDKEEKQEKTKLRNAIQKGNLECAQIHAENAIRKKNEGLNYMRMSSRIDAVAARVQTALTTKKTSQLMDKFETEFVNLDVQSATMENAMSATSTLNAPQNEVDKLMQQVADEAGLELNMQLPSGQMSTIVGTSKNSAEQDELSQRLAKLRQI